MPPYLTVDEFKVRTIMPSEQVDQIQDVHPGWLDAQLESSSRWADMWLAKRYRVPLQFPPPEAVRSWVARMVTRSAYLHHGIPATDQQIAVVIADADKAEGEIKQAADGQLGLIDLATSDTQKGGVVYGGSRVYSEASPYVGHDVQRERAWSEDRSRRGT